MAYTLCISLSLGQSMIGLSLVAQLLSSDASDLGSPILSGFAEIGMGNYLWKYDGFPDGFRGGVKFYTLGYPLNIVSFIAINPEDISLSSDEININVGHSSINIDNSTLTPIGNDTLISISKGTESLSPNVSTDSIKEVNSGENINITLGSESTGTNISVNSGTRG